MLKLLPLIPLLPLLGFLALTLASIPRRWVPWVGAGSVGLAALLTALLGAEFLAGQQTPHVLQLWTWMRVGDFSPAFALYLDALALNMLFVVTGVGFLIHVYSAGFMADDPGYARFFAYMNLFVAAMLILVLAQNLLLLYLGWEGVGLCSYLLIGFWYDNPANGLAARKAFVMTRVGDTAMLLGLFLLFRELGTLDIQPLMQEAAASWAVGDPLPTLAALLLLGGAMGKSAQLPLQSWLPDAMAGPTPISALIHAATMVTAGVYLIARTHALFELAPAVLELVAAVGAATLLLAGCAALAQRDIKRILAYSTISQIGYMFLALGVGAWSSAIFHLTTHAYFKALLFLAAGAVIHCYHHEHDIFRMGGLRQKLPTAFWSFIVGSAALAALPFTAGYYSKHAILMAAYGSGDTLWLWAAGTLGAVITGLYSFRLVFVAFFGPEYASDHGTGSAHGHAPSHEPDIPPLKKGERGDFPNELPRQGPEIPPNPLFSKGGNGTEKLGVSMTAPLLVLGLLTLLGGLFPLPLDSVFPSAAAAGESNPQVGLATALAPWLGLAAAALIYLTRTFPAEALVRSAWADALRRFWFSGWGFDWLYGKLIVDPFLWLAKVNRTDAVDRIYRGIAAANVYGHRRLAATQTGQLRWYAAGMMGGVILLLAWGAWP